MIEYCAAAVRDRKTEQVRVLFLNNNGRLMADELCHDGIINHAPVYPREVARRAVELSAVSIIMVHNHPGGDPTPSRADIETTRQVIAACAAPLGIKFHDRIVIAATGSISMRALGYI